MTCDLLNNGKTFASLNFFKCLWTSEQISEILIHNLTWLPCLLVLSVAPFLCTGRLRSFSCLRYFTYLRRFAYIWYFLITDGRPVFICRENYLPLLIILPAWFVWPNILCSSDPYQYKSDEFFFYKGCGPTTCHCMLLDHTAVFQMRGQLLTKSIVLPLPGMLLTGAELPDLVLLLLCWKDTSQIAQIFFFKLTLFSNCLLKISLLYTRLSACSVQSKF